ncbi:hypothetical protein D9M72_359090 [compost metagenome]
MLPPGLRASPLPAMSWSPALSGRPKAAIRMRTVFRWRVAGRRNSRSVPSNRWHSGRRSAMNAPWSWPVCSRASRPGGSGTAAEPPESSGSTSTATGNSNASSRNWTATSPTPCGWTGGSPSFPTTKATETCIRCCRTAPDCAATPITKISMCAMPPRTASGWCSNPPESSGCSLTWVQRQSSSTFRWDRPPRGGGRPS